VPLLVSILPAPPPVPGTQLDVNPIRHTADVEFDVLTDNQSHDVSPCLSVRLIALPSVTGSSLAYPVFPKVDAVYARPACFYHRRNSHSVKSRAQGHTRYPHGGRRGGPLCPSGSRMRSADYSESNFVDEKCHQE